MRRGRKAIGDPNGDGIGGLVMPDPRLRDPAVTEQYCMEMHAFYRAVFLAALFGQPRPLSPLEQKRSRLPETPPVALSDPSGRR